MTEPPILLADEPTGNLDTRTSIEVMEIFQRLQRERGITVIVITHEPQIAEYGSRIISFRDGRIVSDTPNTRRAAWRATSSEQLPALSVDRGRVRDAAARPLPASRSRDAAAQSAAVGLTLLGITIGVGAVLTMVAVGNGARASIEDQVVAAGMNVITVTAGNYQMKGEDGGGGVGRSPGAARCRMSARRRCGVPSTDDRRSLSGRVIRKTTRWRSTIIRPRASGSATRRPGSARPRR